jgi:hypothetical protein
MQRASAAPSGENAALSATPVLGLPPVRGGTRPAASRPDGDSLRTGVPPIRGTGRHPSPRAGHLGQYAWPTDAARPAGACRRRRRLDDRHLSSQMPAGRPASVTADAGRAVGACHRGCRPGGRLPPIVGADRVAGSRSSGGADRVAGARLLGRRPVGERAGHRPARPGGGRGPASAGLTLLRAGTIRPPGRPPIRGPCRRAVHLPEACISTLPNADPAGRSEHGRSGREASAGLWTSPDCG